MSPEQRERAKAVVLSLLSAAPEQWEEGARRACGGDETVLEEALSLLRAHGDAGSFLSPPADTLSGCAPATDEPPAFSAGTVLASRFRIVRFIDRGGMGEVYEAEDGHLGLRVAVKTLRPDLARNERVRSRFIREVLLARRVSHPNVCRIFDIGSHRPSPDREDVFLTMEFLEGETLAQRVARGRLDPAEALPLVAQMAAGLAAAHREGVVHRDFKSRNLILVPAGANRPSRVVITDFGLAVGPQVGASATSGSGLLVGTPAYMAPEQVEGRRSSPATDLYSLGVVMYEMVTGTTPFQAASPLTTALRRLHERPPSPRLHAPDLPAVWESVILKCLERDARARFSSPGEVVGALEGGALRRPGRGERLRALRERLGARWPPKRRLKAGLVAASLVAAGALAIWLSRPTVPLRPTATVHAVPLTSLAGREFQPSLSRDGEHVAFVWDGESADNFDIYQKIVGSETVLRLTRDAAEDCCPAWSPDGRFVAFIRIQGADSAAYVVRALGGPERRLQPLRPWFGSGLSWSPDGRWLVLSDRDAPGQPAGLQLLSPETLETRHLTRPSSRFLGDAFPSFSPDGGAVAFVRFPATSDTLTASELHVVATSGGEPRRLALDPVLVGGLDWTPDGRSLIFSSGPGEYRLRRAAVAGGPSEPLDAGADTLLTNAAAESVGEVSRAARVSVSRTGGRVAYTRSSHDTDIWKVVLDQRGEPTGPPARWIASTRLEEAPQFSPDGTRVAFASTRASRAPEIWVSDADGGNLVQLTSLGVHSGTPRWSPDGRRIAFDSRPGGQSDVHVIEVDSLAIRRVTTDPAEDVVPSWSADGRFIYFASDRGGAWRVWKVAAQGGPAVRVTGDEGFAAFESGSGTFLYYTRASRRGLWKAPLAGGDAVQVLDDPRCWGYWALGTTGIYFLSGTARPHIDLMPYTGNGRRTILELPGPPACAESGLALSPDGSVLLVVAVQQGSDLMMLEGLP